MFRLSVSLCILSLIISLPLTGQLVFPEEVLQFPTGKSAHQLLTPGLPPGVYLLALRSEDVRLTKKVVN